MNKRVHMLKVTSKAYEFEFLLSIRQNIQQKNSGKLRNLNNYWEFILPIHGFFEPPKTLI